MLRFFSDCCCCCKIVLGGELLAFAVREGEGAEGIFQVIRVVNAKPVNVAALQHITRINTRV